MFELHYKEGVYLTIVDTAFCFFLYLTGVHFRGELQHGGDVSQQKIKCRPIRTWEIGGVSLSDVLNVKQLFYDKNLLTKHVIGQNQFVISKFKKLKAKIHDQMIILKWPCILILF